MARAHQIGSAGFDDDSTTIPTGEISFQVGDRAAANITIDDSNNTVSGLVDAINEQSDDISASIVYDQANSANRILLTSRHTGEATKLSSTITWQLQVVLKYDLIFPAWLFKKQPTLKSNSDLGQAPSWPSTKQIPLMV